MVESFTTTSFSLLNLAMFFGLLAWSTALFLILKHHKPNQPNKKLLLAFTACKVAYPLYIFLAYDPMTTHWLQGFTSLSVIVLILLIPCLFLEGAIFCLLLNQHRESPIDIRLIFAAPIAFLVGMLVFSFGSWVIFHEDAFVITQTRHNEQLPLIVNDFARILSNSVYSNGVLALVGLYLLKGCQLRQLFSENSLNDSANRWLYGFLCTYLVLLLCNGLSYSLDIGSLVSSPIVLGLSFTLMTLFHIASFVWLGLVVYALLINKPSKVVDTQKDRYLSASYVEQVKNHMVEHQPYLKNALSLERLAEDIGIPSKALSLVMNNVYGCSFSEYISQQRLEHAKKLLVESPSMKVEEVATASGFNSRSSFFSVFKKMEGRTPSEYRKQHQ